MYILIDLTNNEIHNEYYLYNENMIIDTCQQNLNTEDENPEKVTSFDRAKYLLLTRFEYKVCEIKAE